jgi:hypothetical protein
MAATWRQMEDMGESSSFSPCFCLLASCRIFGLDDHPFVRRPLSLVLVVSIVLILFLATTTNICLSSGLRTICDFSPSTPPTAYTELRNFRLHRN